MNVPVRLETVTPLLPLPLAPVALRLLNVKFPLLPLPPTVIATPAAVRRKRFTFTVRLVLLLPVTFADAPSISRPMTVTLLAKVTEALTLVTVPLPLFIAGRAVLPEG